MQLTYKDLLDMYFVSDVTSDSYYASEDFVLASGYELFIDGDEYRSANVRDGWVVLSSTHDWQSDLRCKLNDDAEVELYAVSRTLVTELDRVPEEYRKWYDNEYCLEAVNEHWTNLECVKNKTPEICLAAVKNRGNALKYITVQTEELVTAAVANGASLDYVDWLQFSPAFCKKIMDSRTSLKSN